MQTKASDRQVGGDHYVNLSVDTWDAIKAWFPSEAWLGYLKGNAIKYLTRTKVNELEDVQKAIHYLQRLEEELILNGPN